MTAGEPPDSEAEAAGGEVGAAGRTRGAEEARGAEGVGEVGVAADMAAAVGAAALMTTQVGTVAYSPPEVPLGVYDYKADVFSLTVSWQAHVTHAQLIRIRSRGRSMHAYTHALAHRW